MLTTLLLMLVLGLVFGMVALGVGVGLILRAFAERSRLHPSIQTGAPLDWCWSPSAPARLHRRLQSALLPIHPARPGRHRPTGDSLTELVSTIAGQATRLDREIIAARRLRGPARRGRLRVLRAEVREIEQLSYRVQEQRLRMARATGPSPQEALADVHSRLDLLAAADAELTAIEQASTATDPDEVLRQIAPRPAVPVERHHSARHTGRPTRR
jgi:hypothetical protein